MKKSIAPFLAVFTAALLVSACSPEEGKGDRAALQEATALTGEPLYRAELSPESRERLEADLAAAMTDLKANPDAAGSYIWAGRRLGYLGRYQDAIGMLSQGIEKFPGDSRLYRHRGHRYISIRKFPEAIADFEQAVELIAGQEDSVEPDGAPNPLGIPTSTRHGNIYYHLALAHYLMGNYEAALPVYRRGLEIATNSDSTISLTHWLYSALRRLGRDEEAAAAVAAVPSGGDVIENHAYRDLVMMYKDEKAPEELLAGSDGGGIQDVALLYGIANYYWVNGRQQEAIVLMEKILETGAWAAFGYIAAEADLARLD